MIHLVQERAVVVVLRMRRARRRRRGLFRGRGEGRHDVLQLAELELAQRGHEASLGYHFVQDTLDVFAPGVVVKEGGVDDADEVEEEGGGEGVFELEGQEGL